jgi:hypothetical protein
MDSAVKLLQSDVVGGESVKNTYRILFVLSALLFLSNGRASADTLLSYDIVGPVSISFELPTTPTVLLSSSGFGFEVTPTDLMINGVASNDFLTFYNSAFGGGFGACSAGNCLDFLASGPQLYTGPEATPTMIALTSVALTDSRTGGSAGTVSTTSTPEPSAIVLLALGLIALVGYAFFSKRMNRLSLAVN